MAIEDKRIDQLPAVTILSPDSLLVLQQNGQAMCLTVEQLMAYINDGATQAVLFAPQTLTDEQKEQARDNIGAVANIRWSSSRNTTNFIRDIGSNTLYTYLRLVRYDDDQTGLTEEEKAQARANIGAAATGEGGGGGTAEGAVLYTEQTLTEEQQQQARKNIGAVGVSAAAVGQVIAVKTVDANGMPTEWETIHVQGGTITDSVLYTPQSLTPEQKAQARKNIGATEDAVHHHSHTAIFNYPGNGTVLLNHFIRYGKVCTFTIQLNITEQISDKYGFAIMTLPFTCVGRLWLNNDTKYYIDDNTREILRNASSTPVGGITLSGVYITSDE